MVPPAGRFNPLARSLITCFLSASSLLGATHGLNIVSNCFSSWVGCPLQARAIDGAVVNAGICARLGTRGVELPPGPPDQRSPGTRGSQSRRERARQRGGTRQASPFRSAPFGRCFLIQARFPAAKVPCREIPRTRLPPWSRRRWASQGSRLQNGNSPPNHPQSPNIPAMSTRPTFSFGFGHSFHFTPNV